MIRFNKASITELEKKNVIDAMENSILSGDGNIPSKFMNSSKNVLEFKTCYLPHQEQQH